MIEVFSRIAVDPRFELVIAGDGSERSRLEHLAATRELSHRITFLGHVPQPERLRLSRIGRIRDGSVLRQR
jgi:glycosyltransferase involved in cell wall biosynthesis